MQTALTEIQSVSPTGLKFNRSRLRWLKFNRSSSGMGSYCLTSFLNDAYHSLVLTLKACSESKLNFQNSHQLLMAKMQMPDQYGDWKDKGTMHNVWEILLKQYLEGGWHSSVAEHQASNPKTLQVQSPGRAGWHTVFSVSPRQLLCRLVCAWPPLCIYGMHQNVRTH